MVGVVGVGGWGGMLCTQCKNAALAKHCIQQAGHLEIILTFWVKSFFSKIMWWLTFYANWIPRREFAWNANPYFLDKKNMNLSFAEFAIWNKLISGQNVNCSGKYKI